MSELVKFEAQGFGGMDLASLGGVLAKSGFFADTRDAAQAIVKVLAGQELGIGPIAAMTGLHIIKGRVAIGANIMAAAVKRSGKYDYRVAELTDSVCRLVFTEGGKQIGESVFTAADAKKAQTQNTDKFPRNMLFARALSNGVRWYCPDVFSTTVYTPDELRGGGMEVEVSDRQTVNVVTGEITDTPPHRARTHNAPPPPPSERDVALGEMRQAWKAAKSAGADIPTPAPADVTAMSLEDLRLWRDTYRAEEQKAKAPPQAEGATFTPDQAGDESDLF